jgi:RNA polymerase sigma-B factor
LTDTLPESLSREGRSELTSKLLSQARYASDSERRRIEDLVIEANVPVAASVAHRFRGRGLDGDDLEQVAYLGLVKAVRGFEVERGAPFLSFAVPTIRGEIKRHFRDHVWAVRPPRELQEVRAAIPAAEEELTARLHRSPRPQEIADHCGLDVELVIEALSRGMHYRAVSLDQPLDAGDQTSGSTLSDFVPTIDDDISWAETSLDLQAAVRTLSARDRQILARRIRDEWTQQQIADELGVSQMQVSRLLRSILARLRTIMGRDDIAL